MKTHKRVLSTKCVPSIIRTDGTLNLKQRGRLGSDAWLWHTLRSATSIPRKNPHVWKSQPPVLRPDVTHLISAPVMADTISGGDTAWILTSTALVLFMTIPGLSLFYAGLVRVKNVLSVLMQCLR